jgi:hypothetical protein
MSHKDERKFLHDVASPLAAALFIIDMVKDEAEEKSGVASREAKQAKQVQELLSRIRSLLEERRAVLIQSDESDPKAA